MLIQSTNNWSASANVSITSMFLCTYECGLCLHCAGGSSFGVSLLGGVRNRNGDLQTFVTSVDERCHHEDGFDIQEGVCIHYMCMILYI